MVIQTSPQHDGVHPKKNSGAYEWWYFDAVDFEGRFSFVVIFYEGNPFSPAYLKDFREDTSAMASSYPALSCSIYEYGKPVYYSFTEFQPEDAVFDDAPYELRVGDHTMRFEETENGNISYVLQLCEYLPSGDSISAQLQFQSGPFHQEMESEASAGGHQRHSWFLIQPRASVEGYIQLGNASKITSDIRFEGTGYHDHNLGSEPLFQQFNQWYWGRFHFKSGHTVIYYAMEELGEWKNHAWLLQTSGNSIKLVEWSEKVELEDRQLSHLGLASARRIRVTGESFEAFIHQVHPADNGPFYQRYVAEGVLHSGQYSSPQKALGVSEYIKPDRISWPVFWPMVRMRLRFGRQASHWVQKSPKLYRWTW